MMMEMMGVHLPAAAFFNPYTPMREALTRAAAARLSDGIKNRSIKPIGEMLSEKSFVNAIIGLMATGGSTNHTMHLVAMARAAGIILNWDDFDDISAIVPLLIRVYPPRVQRFRGIPHDSQPEVYLAAPSLIGLDRRVPLRRTTRQSVPDRRGRTLRYYEIGRASCRERV